MKFRIKRILSLTLTVCMLLSVCAAMPVGVGAQEMAFVYNGIAPKINGVTFATENKTSKMLQSYTSDQGETVYNPNYSYTYPVYSATFSASTSISNSSGFVKNMKSAHPRLLTQDFSVYVDRAESDFTSRRYFNNVMSAANKYLDVEPYLFYMNIRNNINDFCGNIEQRIVTLAMAYNLQKIKTQRGDADAVTDYEKYADRAIEEMLNAAAYPHWSQDAFLCTAEISTGFAFGYDWLYDYLHLEKNAAALQTIKDSIYEMSLTAYAWNYSKAKYWGTNNWNEVCNGAGIITAIAFYDSADTTGKYSVLCEYVLESAAHYLYKGLIQYKYDGFFREGIGYWSYATEYLTRAVACYQSAALDDYVLPERFQHMHVEGVSKTAEFPIYMNGITGVLNFGDCSQSIVYSEVLYWFANYFNKPEYSAYLNAFLQRFNKTFKDEEAAYALIWYVPQKDDFGILSRLEPDVAHTSKDDVNILTMRNAFDNDIAFVGMHGGDFSASHNGMSLGSFVLDMQGKRFVKSLGAGNYVWPGYFSNTNETSQRYTYYCMRAEGNNTLVVDPGYSGEMKKGAFVKIIDSGTSKNTGYGIMDLTSTNDKFAKHYRGVMLTDNRTRVVVQDEFKASSEAGAFKDVYWFAHTGDPENGGANVEISADGKSAVLTIGTQSIVAKITKGPGKFEWVDASPLSSSPNPEIQQARMDKYGKKLRIHMQNIVSATLRVEFSPLGQETNNVPYAALADWKTQLSDQDEAGVDTYLNQNQYELDWYASNYKTYYIHDDKDLAGLAYLVNQGQDFAGKTVKLVNDIVMNDALYWTPIGTDDAPFKGVFDGSQKKISNIKVKDSRRNGGLFGKVQDATVKNLLLENAQISGLSDVGTLAGTAESSTIVNVFSNNLVVRGTTRIGGLVGVQTMGSIVNCGVSGCVYGTGTYSGGVVAYTTGLVDNCIANVRLAEFTKTITTTVTTAISENENGELVKTVTTSAISKHDTTGEVVGTSGPNVVVSIISEGEVGETTEVTTKQEAICGSNCGGVVGLSAYGNVKNSYYLYAPPLVPGGMRPYAADSVNLSNSCGKIVSSFVVSSVAGISSVLNYKGRTPVDCMNAWIDDPANVGEYIRWKKTSTSNMAYATAIPSFVPETVVDLNDSKDLFEISTLSTSADCLNIQAVNKKSTTNTGYLIVTQIKNDGTSDVKFIHLSVDAQDTKNISVPAIVGAEVRIFVLDSVLNMKIKSNVISL